MFDRTNSSLILVDVCSLIDSFLTESSIINFLFSFNSKIEYKVLFNDFPSIFVVLDTKYPFYPIRSIDS